MLEYTPMMLQYLDIKKNYEDTLLLFRLGDFYEMFFEDALKAVEVLDITLTKKSCGKKDGEQLKIDMCGVPFHAVEGYIAKLVSKGHKVAICEQVEDAKEATGKIVKRDVVRVITAGTIIETNLLEETKNNYIMCIFENKAGFSIAVCDVSTGEFLSMEFSLVNKLKLIDEIAKYNPSEILSNNDFNHIEEIEKIFNKKIYKCLDFYFNMDNATQILQNHFSTHNLSGFGINGEPMIICVSGALLRYLIDTQKTSLMHISSIKKYTSSQYMSLDISSRRNLELTETIREKSKKGSLLWVLDKTNTPMGGRLIRKWIEQPLVNQEMIEERLESIESLLKNPIEREVLINSLSQIKDIERLLTKISYQTANARDILALKNSFVNLPSIKKSLGNIVENNNKNNKNNKNMFLLEKIYNKFDDLIDLYECIDSAIDDEEQPPISIRDGGLIKKGYSEVIDKYRSAKTEGADWLDDLQEKERRITGIKNLKIKNNKIFGRYIEVTNSYLNLIPDYFIRRQTLANCERFITQELKEIEEILLNADEKLSELEFEEFCKIRNFLFENITRIQGTANLIAQIDTICSFAVVAEKNNYTRPILIDDGSGDTNIKLGRHPVVELLTEDIFIPNDSILDKDKNRLAVITGPNMAGKSTYMRQIALIILMAQIGCYVPCEKAEICIVDRIFTRVGASDDLATGQSTFMVEMSEVANILNNATSNSLLILDEIGRGTSTYDGLSIAWAVLEHIADKTKIGARTLFATHYHEITDIENKIDGVNNYCVEVKDNGDDIIFLRKIIRGIAVSSYGIHVAKLAGIPTRVLNRANEVLSILGSYSNQKSNSEDYTGADTYGLINEELLLNEETSILSELEEDFYYDTPAIKSNLFVDEVEKEFKDLDINNITPMEAWKKLSIIKESLDNL